HRDQARDMAMRAAREKASALAAAVGQKIGKAYSIAEDVPSRSFAAQNSTANSFSIDSDGSASSEGTLALGLIKVNARVTVRFELE
ncbi:MAG: hypothetical protein QOG71_1643, partial [Pyrinomonadaceae bacterium]|nr:hypothetical protein [Pyrinomonadaceae bacterium]